MDHVVDWANVLAAIGTIVALVYAARADKKSGRAIQLSIEQGRRTFELEVLKELARSLYEIRDLDAPPDGSVDEQILQWSRDVARLVNEKVRSLLLMLPKDELTTWRVTSENVWPTRGLDVLLGMRQVSSGMRLATLRAKVHRDLENEVLSAINCRMAP